MVFPCAWRRVHATMTNRTGAPAVTRMVGYAPEELVDIPLTLHSHQRLAMRINVCLFDSRIDWIL